VARKRFLHTIGFLTMRSREYSFGHWLHSSHHHNAFGLFINICYVTQLHKHFDKDATSFIVHMHVSGNESI
jgi:hypothetical protein